MITTSSVFFVKEAKVLADEMRPESPEMMSAKATTASTVLITICLTFGIYLPLFVSAICRLIRRPAKGCSQWIHMGATVLTGIMTLMYFVSTVVYTMRLLQYPAVHDEAAKRISGLFGSISGVGPIYLVCDGLVAWRAWVLYPKHKKITGTIAIFMLSSLAVISVLFYVYAIKADTNVAYSPVVARMLYLIFVPPVLSMIVNLVATIAIFYKLRQIYDYAKERRLPSYKALVVLVETGLIYVLIQIASVTLYFTQGESPQAPLLVFLGAMPIIAAIYPVLLINLITHHLNQPDRQSVDMNIRDVKSPGKHGPELKLHRVSTTTHNLTSSYGGSTGSSSNRESSLIAYGTSAGGNGPDFPSSTSYYTNSNGLSPIAAPYPKTPGSIGGSPRSERVKLGR